MVGAFPRRGVSVAAIVTMVCAVTLLALPLPQPRPGAPGAGPAISPRALPTSASVPLASGSGLGGVVAGIPVGAGPTAIAFDNQTGELYVTEWLSRTVSVINGTSNKLVATIPLPASPSGTPGSIAYDPQNGLVYAVDTPYVTVIRAVNHSLVTNISVGANIRDLAYDPADQRMFVSDANNSVDVIDAKTNRVVASVSVGAGPTGLAYDSANGLVYVANWGSGASSSNVTVVNASQEKTVGSVGVGTGPVGVAVDVAAALVFVANSDVNGPGDVTVINTTTNKVQTTFASGLNPTGVAVDTSNHLVYVSDYGSNATTVFDPATSKVLGSVQLGIGPTGMGFDPRNGYIYAADQRANVTVLDPRAATYAVQFNETGLPSSNLYQWTIELNNSVFDSTYANTTTLGFMLTNGTYSYRAWNMRINFVPEPAIATFVVRGTGEYLSIRFVPAYQVLFRESGLPTGTDWSVWLINDTNTGGTNQPTIPLFLAPNGTWAFGVVALAGYDAVPNNGTVTVAGANVTVNVTFTTQVSGSKFTIQITESGLATGTNWSAVFNLTSSSSNGVVRFSTITKLFFSTNTSGSYTWLVRPVSGYSCSACNGTLSFAPGPGYTTYGVAVSFNSTSSASTYAVGFKESGLPSGATWAVRLGATTHNSTSSAITFREPNGTYTYGAPNVSGYNASHANGSVTVNGGPVNVSIQFSAATSNGSGLRILAFTIQPSRLPVGATMTVTVVTSGGVAPLRYAYTGFPVGCSPPEVTSWSCEPTAAGGSTARVTVTDARGAHVSTTASLQVTPGPGPGLTEFRAYGVGIGIVAILIVVALVVVVDRRSRGATDRAAAGGSDPYRSAARNVRPLPDGGGAGSSEHGEGTTRDPDELSGLV